jgi:hypothetical protein
MTGAGPLLGCRAASRQKFAMLIFEKSDIEGTQQIHPGNRAISISLIRACAMPVQPP